jgi:hypothetical protein
MYNHSRHNFHHLATPSPEPKTAAHSLVQALRQNKPSFRVCIVDPETVRSRRDKCRTENEAVRLFGTSEGILSGVVWTRVVSGHLLVYCLGLPVALFP